MTPKSLVGTWSLVDFTITYADGRPPLSPLGGAAEGLLLYAADGHVSAVLSSAQRPLMGTGSLEREGTPPGGYVSYAGRWRLEGDTVQHTVLMSLVPDVVGQTLSRRARLQAGLLELTYQRTPASGVTRTYCLSWRRPGGCDGH